MRIAKCFLMMALLVAAFAQQLKAQNLQANIAGSTAFWLEAGEAAYTLGGTTTTCAWTTSLSVDGSSFVIDQRVPALPQYFPFSVDYGALWVTWTTGSTGTCAAPSSDSNVWAYISLDSVLGDRCFFAQPQCTLNVGSFNQSNGVVTPLAPGTAGANALPGVTDTPIPASVLNAFNGQTISIAATDILPVDAKFSSYSVLSQCGPLGSGTQFIGLGDEPDRSPPSPSIATSASTTSTSTTSMFMAPMERLGCPSLPIDYGRRHSGDCSGEHFDC